MKLTEKLLITGKEAAEILGISQTKIIELNSQGFLKKAKGVNMYNRQDIYEYANAGEKYKGLSAKELYRHIDDLTYENSALKEKLIQVRIAIGEQYE